MSAAGLGRPPIWSVGGCPSWSVTLNEFNPRSCELAREIYGLDVVSNDAGELRKMDRRFDVISAISVVEHITTPLPFLRSYAGLLKKGGMLAIVVPQFTHLNAAVSKAASPNVTPPFHVSLFQRRNLRMLLDRAGCLENVEITEFGAPAFSLLHHYDVAEYWDISIPTADQPIPRSIMVKEYPLEISIGLNALEKADEAAQDYFSETDGRLYLTATGSGS